VSARRLTVSLLIAAVTAVALPIQASAAYRYGARVMKMGSKGKDVRKLQRNLTTLGYPTPADGVFGPTTKKSVKKLEGSRGWRRDGRVSRKDAVRITKLVAKRKAKPGKLFFLNGLVKPSLEVTATNAGTATVDVSETAGGQMVAQIPLTFAAPGSQKVEWNGINATGAGAPEGTYRMTVSDPGTAEAAGVQAKSFSFYWHAFPVPGPHDFGGKGSRFGADRGDHVHQGQDMAAACGERLYVSTGGVVTTKAYQAGGAGYYIVIKGSATGESSVYMHMIKPSWAKEGETVYTGQQIGKVGNTGSSTGCHLHFELWTAPGWYEGGSPYDPLPKLRAWDAYS
jgi:murein DD-endopeptidase MepM/ murein hydrolase activator NlpD